MKCCYEDDKVIKVLQALFEIFFDFWRMSQNDTVKAATVFLQVFVSTTKI